MPVEITPPKYAVVANTVQERIMDGTYPPGSKLPSESQLVEEFGASRPMVVRALEILKREGWIDSHPGKGRYVRALQAVPGRQVPQYAGGLLGEEPTEVKVLAAGPVLVPDRAASALGIASGTPVIARQRLTVSEVGPVELSTVYVPVELAAGTEVGRSGPVEGGLLRHLAQVKGVGFDHAASRVSARTATADEARLLEIARREVVLTLLVTVYDRSGSPQLCVDAVLPVARHELEDAFPLS